MKETQIGTGSQMTDLPVIMDDFELERCFDDAHTDRIETADIESWSSLPLPEKFPPRSSSKAQDAVSKFTSRKLAAKYMANSRRVMGTMLVLEEAARWSCSEVEIRKSACCAAGLMLMHDFDKK